MSLQNVLWSTAWAVIKERDIFRFQWGVEFLERVFRGSSAEWSLSRSGENQN